MISVGDNTAGFVSSFEAFHGVRHHGQPGWLRAVRKKAIDRFAELGFPSKKDEEWRFTDLASFKKTPFEFAANRTARPAGRPGQPGQGPEMEPDGGHRLVFVNGRFCDELSLPGPLPRGVIVGSLRRALCSHSDLIEAHLTRHAKYHEHPFVALNTACFRDGAFVYLPPGCCVDVPIVLRFLWTPVEYNGVANLRNLIVAEPGSQATILESYAGEGSDAYLSNVVSEIVLKDSAVLDHYKIQREGEGAFHFATLQARQDRSSRLRAHWISLGGALVRNETNVVLDAEDCECTLNGLYLAGGKQHVDSRSRLDHAKPHTRSRQLYKGILDGAARGVFNGKIIVHEDAQKTDARQTNRTLLLSDAATINTKPQLEIFADDVKCTHGATVGQLDPAAMFYLRSRGIPREKARDLLVYAFAADLLDRILIADVRSRLEAVLLASRGLPSEINEGLRR